VPETTRINLQPHELSKMIIGDDDVDVSRWKQLCSGDYAGDEVVAWFWEHMESCSAAERLCVLQWTTGYSRLPDDTLSFTLGSSLCALWSSFAVAT
jgi:hypothetical protein